MPHLWGTALAGGPGPDSFFLPVTQALSEEFLSTYFPVASGDLSLLSMLSSQSSNNSLALPFTPFTPILALWTKCPTRQVRNTVNFPKCGHQPWRGAWLGHGQPLAVTLENKVTAWIRHWTAVLHPVHSLAILAIWAILKQKHT